MPLRRLDDRIRELSDQVVGASRDELDVILPTLLAAIHEKMERLRSLAINRFLGGPSLGAASIPALARSAFLRCIECLLFHRLASAFVIFPTNNHEFSD
jgi:hypothetical protein